MAPSAPACSTRAMLLQSLRSREKAPWGGDSILQTPAARRDATLLVWGRRVLWDTLVPNHAGCALGARAGGRRFQLRAMQDPSPSCKINLHLACVAHVPLGFCVHGKHGHGSEEAARDGASGDAEASPAAIPRHTTNISGHHLLKRCCQQTPTPGATKLPIPPQGSLSGRVHGQRRARVSAGEGAHLEVVPPSSQPPAPGCAVGSQEPELGHNAPCSPLPCQAALPVPALPN